MKLHRQNYPPEFVEDLLRKQIDDFTWRIRAMVALQWLSIISLITVIADTFCSFVFGMHPLIPMSQKLVAALLCGGAIYSKGWAIGYMDELRDDAEISLEKLLFGESTDDGGGKGKK